MPILPDILCGLVVWPDLRSSMNAGLSSSVRRIVSGSRSTRRNSSLLRALKRRAMTRLAPAVARPPSRLDGIHLMFRILFLMACYSIHPLAFFGRQLTYPINSHLNEKSLLPTSLFPAGRNILMLRMVISVGRG